MGADRQESYHGHFVIQAKHTSVPTRSLTPSLIADELDKVQRLVAEGRCDVYQTISENSRLRMLVPRLYGLGDLA